MSDDDDISVIALSDDEGSRALQQVKRASSPPQAKVQPHAEPTRMGAKGSSDGRGADSAGPSSSSGRGRSHVKVERVYEDDEEGEEDEEGVGYDDDDEEEDYDDEGHYQGGDKVLDEEGLEYISNRFASRQTGGSGPTTWLEVNEDEIREVCARWEVACMIWAWEDCGRGNCLRNLCDMGLTNVNHSAIHDLLKLIRVLSESGGRESSVEHQPCQPGR